MRPRTTTTSPPPPHPPAPRVPVLEVRLVADEHDRHRGGRVLLCVLEPRRKVVEGLSASDVVDQKRAGGTAVVGASDRAEGLLARLRGCGCGDWLSAGARERLLAGRGRPSPFLRFPRALFQATCGLSAKRWEMAASWSAFSGRLPARLATSPNLHQTARSVRARPRRAPCPRSGA
jgi:hypothetical protein